MKSTVAPEKREEWVKTQVKTGIDVIIANPKLVQTGLDLYDFPTLVFFQTGYSVFTLRQASRRSWRIGQRKPVKIYYLFYTGTMQERAMELMGKKMEASLAIEGKFSEEGLLAMTSGEDMTTALAKTLTEGLEDEGAEYVWKKLNEKNRVFDAVSGYESLNQEDEVITPSIEPDYLIPQDHPGEEDKVIYIDFVAFRGKKKVKDRMAIRAGEMDTVLEEKKKEAVQFSMFE